jgi:murein L,D-transpeptidase YafK
MGPLKKALIAGFGSIYLAIVPNCQIMNDDRLVQPRSALEDRLEQPRVMAVFEPRDLTNHKAVSNPQYQEWIESALENSMKKGYSIIVDKSLYRLFLVERGKVHSIYPIELGWDTLQDKVMQGDGRTPEGIFKVLVKKDEGQTHYHKAFLIDYPTKRHRNVYERLRRAGSIPIDKDIGGDIEVHGSGTGWPGNSGGKNWTAGCIALSDRDMDALFAYVRQGTSIVIVGSGME